MTPEATTQQIMDKLESVYGNIRSAESVLSEFYMAKQGKEEDVSEWGLRLESILQKAIDTGHVKEEQRDEMLKVRFWRHLHDESLKNATRLCFETSKSFEELRRKVRIEENEMKPSREQGFIPEDHITFNQHKGEDEKDTIMRKILERMERLEQELTKVQEKSRGEKFISRGDQYRDDDIASRRARRDYKERDRYKYNRYDRGYRPRYKDYMYRGKRDYRVHNVDGDDRDRYNQDFEGYDRKYEDKERRRTYQRYPREYRDEDGRYTDDRRRNRTDDRYGYDRERNYYMNQDCKQDDGLKSQRDTDSYSKTTKVDKVSPEKSEENVKGDPVLHEAKQHQRPRTSVADNKQHKPLNR